MRIISAAVIEGISYEYPTEDGVGSTWNLLIQATDRAGNVYTHEREFDMKHERKAAASLAEKVNQAGDIDLDHWRPGSPWDVYSTPQTWDEEKADYFEREAMTGSR
jgi:hypothetical protein